MANENKIDNRKVIELLRSALSYFGHAATWSGESKAARDRHRDTYHRIADEIDRLLEIEEKAATPA